MGHLKLSEKAKDRSLNVILVCSLFLLVASLSQSAPARQADDNSQNNYSVSQLEPLETAVLPVFEEAAAIPAPPPQPASVPENSSHAPSSAPQTQPAAPSAQTVSKNDQKRRMPTPPRNSSFPNTLGKIFDFKSKNLL